MTASASEKILADHQGFQIVRRDDSLIFIDRHTRGVAIAAFVLFGLSGISLLCGVLFVVIGATQERSLLGAALPLLLFAGVVALGGRSAYRAYRARQQGPGERLIAETGALKSAQGQELAPLSQVTTTTSIDLTDGMGGLRFARVLSLRWPGGRRRIYKSYDQDELARLRGELGKIGIR